MEVCENLSLGGKDWYLPSIGELTVLYGVRSTLVAKSPGNNFTNFLNAHYWSSTEYNANVSWSLNFSSGFYDRPGKTTANRVRCVAR